jgi:hypothetical protein
MKAYGQSMIEIRSPTPYVSKKAQEVSFEGRFNPGTAKQQHASMPSTPSPTKQQHRRETATRSNSQGPVSKATPPPKRRSCLSSSNVNPIIQHYLARNSSSRLSIIFNITKLVFLLATTLNLIGDELFVLFQTLLDVQLEAHNVVEHTLDLCVQLFTEGVCSKLELFVPTPR